MRRAAAAEEEGKNIQSSGVCVHKEEAVSLIFVLFWIKIVNIVSHSLRFDTQIGALNWCAVFSFIKKSWILSCLCWCWVLVVKKSEEKKISWHRHINTRWMNNTRAQQKYIARRNRWCTRAGIVHMPKNRTNKHQRSVNFEMDEVHVNSHVAHRKVRLVS